MLTAVHTPWFELKKERGRVVKNEQGWIFELETWKDSGWRRGASSEPGTLIGAIQQFEAWKDRFNGAELEFL